MDNIPAVINNYNVYKDDTKLIGVTSEMTLPSFKAMSSTISGAGIMGEIDIPIPGQYAAMEQEIPFRILDTDMFSMMSNKQAVDLTFRASEQQINRSTGETEYQPIRIVERGLFKEFVPGKLKKANSMEGSVKMEVLYIKIEINNQTALEFDKLNEVFVVNGEDQLAKIRDMC